MKKHGMVVYRCMLFGEITVVFASQADSDLLVQTHMGVALNMILRPGFCVRQRWINVYFAEKRSTYPPAATPRSRSRQWLAEDLREESLSKGTGRGEDLDAFRERRKDSQCLERGKKCSVERGWGI